MKRRGIMFVAAALLSISACSGESITGLDQMVYNATYSGPATFHRQSATPSPLADSTSPLPPSFPPNTIRMTLAQLGQDFSGTFSVVDSAGNPVYAGSVRGRTSSTGADFTLIVPSPCAGVLYGSFTVSAPDGALNGSAAGRDCVAAGTGNNVQITFTSLARQ